MQVTNVRLPNKLVADLDKLADKYDLNRSEVIRQALTIYLQIADNAGTLLRPLSFHVQPASIDYSRRGDITIMKVPTGHAIVVSSTSSGGIGSKAMDVVKVEGSVLGKFLARVALMDTVAVGAFPLLLAVTLGVEKQPYGREILEGVRNEVRTIGLDPNQVVMENTEDNVVTAQTGAGLTVVGFEEEGNLRLGRTRPGDAIVAIGQPRVGDEVLQAEERGQIADLRSVVLLTQKRFVHDIFPVGTYGVESEARMMAHGVGRNVALRDNLRIDLRKSAGPATVVLATMDEERVEDLKLMLSKPVSVVGEVE